MLMNLITFAKGIQTRIKNDYKAVDNISHNVREVPDADGAHVQSSRAYAHVLQAICERDVEVGRRLHSACVADFFFHRCGYLHSNENQRAEPVDASLDNGICHSRDSLAGVFKCLYVFDTCREDRVEHRL